MEERGLVNWPHLYWKLISRRNVLFDATAGRDIKSGIGLLATGIKVPKVSTVYDVILVKNHWGKYIFALET